MNQERKHHFQDKHIEILWRIAQDNQIQNQQIQFEYVQAQYNENLGFGSGVGGIVKMSNGQEYLAFPDEQGKVNIFVDNQWVPLEKNLAEFQQYIPDQIQQQIPQYNQLNNEPSLYVEIRDQNNFNKYRGHITVSDYVSQTQSLGEELEDLYLEIEKNIQSIFDKNSSVYLNMTHKDPQLEFKLKMAKGKKLIDFFIPIKLTLVEQNQEEREKLQKEIKLNKQNKRLENIEQNVNQLQQNLTDHSQRIGFISQELGNQKTELYNKIQNVELNFQYQYQKFLQQKQNQFKKFSINQMKKVKEQDYIYIIQKLKGQCEFELLLVDDEIEFQVGIIEDDDLDNIEKKNKSYFVVLPDGKFTRGTREFGKFFTHQLQLEDKLGLRVDTFQHTFQLVINDYPFPPVKINKSIQEYSFIIKSSEKLNIFADDTNQS
ncbi:unnamed protein product [Paramecium pentaurelia]|uniref:Uncharacterized protein n=1 Tax=Paramecium pentaurelia TaxID=43138 RepID=A0A8S1VV72_9CILI|nr:unnamed protein product [Paramecium pentaurelia]